ncbi:acyl transferase [Marinoscillum sp. MHG1-6]|uniref:LuxE/PaaK family acyltransferase n=1 Tax=Marinoscillum sp. MHG1-6 TaxID=2959627 RepID=UPI00215727D8|nr:acyl transferase [Marinoscillum sp. MHG1-6]
MFDSENFINQFNNFDSHSFQMAALELFKYQWNNNTLYREYCSGLNRTPSNTETLEGIPFLPIEFFKSHQIKTGKWKENKIYLSSATTSSVRSQHFVRYNDQYLTLAKDTFEKLVGPIQKQLILALLPSYQDQGGSSLIAMVDHFMNESGRGNHYFGAPQFDKLAETLHQNQHEKVYLFGVSFALLDFIEQHHGQFPNLTVIETGGMKGRRKEITRHELHEKIRNGLNPGKILSEYGMTELTVQAYSSNAIFQLPAWSKVLIRDINDPFSYKPNQKTGGINIIDLGNIHSCAFIETKDLGRLVDGERFEVLGRYDNSDIRGCNLMAESF